MATLSREHRRLLENTVAQARAVAEEGARKALANQYAVHHHEPWPHMTADDRELRNQLRAHGRQLGDERDTRRETQQIDHLAQACAYEHWHRMLFAQFLAENNLLIDAQYGVAMTLDDVREFAREQKRDWMNVASELAQRMLLAVFRPDDPVLKVQLPPETRQRLEEKLAALPKEVFKADDSLGWVYQFWQRDAKKKVDDELKHGTLADADRIPPKTQLFTEDYMVLFLLENTLGAWWTAKRCAEGKDPALPGYQWTYLRLNEDGSPAVGSFDGWPRTARDLRVLDPCMGSGHFLVFASQIIARMRMEEERVSLKEALAAVLKENLFGLEIDARCSQIAAFNLALAAWRLAGEHFPLPDMNVACSGLGVHASEGDWVKLAGEDGLAREEMRRLYSLFKDAPTLGSLIDPLRLRATVYTAGADRVLPLIEEALRQEPSDESRELAIAARGVVAAFGILASRFTLVATNVPYLGRAKQDPILAQYCEEFHSDGKADLATCFVDRCLRFANNGGSVALVTPQNWLFLGTYGTFRESLLRTKQWDFIARLGPNAFQIMNWWAATTALICLSPSMPTELHEIVGWDVGLCRAQDDKAAALRRSVPLFVKQDIQLTNPGQTISLTELASARPLSDFANVYYGSKPGQTSRVTRHFWEMPACGTSWVYMESSPDGISAYSGKSEICLSTAEIRRQGIAEFGIRGSEAWSKAGVIFAKMRSLPSALYVGQFYDDNTYTVIPTQIEHLPAIFVYLQSSEFNRDARQLNQKSNITRELAESLPFDYDRWQAVAGEHFPDGVPKPHTSDPTQWLFTGHPNDSDYPLQVAVARIAGYRWPRQSGSSFPDCPALEPDGLEKHAESDGILPLNAIAGEASAAERMRALLADAHGMQWSAAKLQKLLSEWDSLEDWLRDGFFEEHCRIFDHRPFVWHIWDGRADGFHALVNYHKLTGSSGEGRQTLEKLIYTYLGSWIDGQNREVKAGKEGADARLTAAIHLKTELEKILEGEKPYDIFVRWKPLHEQPVGWEPDINDGIRLNIRPWLTAQVHQPTRRDDCILRTRPRISFKRDRSEEAHCAKEDFPWFWSWDGRSDDFQGGSTFDGARWNDLHYSLHAKKRAREKKHTAEAIRA